MISEVDALLRVTLPSAGGSRNVELRIPTMAGVHPVLVADDARDAATLAEVLPLVVLQFVSRIDGVRPALADAKAIASDAALMRGVLVRIRSMLETLRERGGAFVLCPGCNQWEAEVPMTAFALAIAVPLPSAFDGPFLVFPSLASGIAAGRRPPLPRAARIRFDLPSDRLKIAAPFSGGVLRDVSREPDETDGLLTTGRKALARLADAIDPRIPARTLHAMPVIDFAFLDLLHFIAYRAPVKSDTRGVIGCASCGTRFLPVGQEAE